MLNVSLEAFMLHTLKSSIDSLSRVQVHVFIFTMLRLVCVVVVFDFSESGSKNTLGFPTSNTNGFLFLRSLKLSNVIDVLCLTNLAIGFIKVDSKAM